MSEDLDTLARTIYGEARGESISGMEAVASVVLNRLAFSRRKGRYWWGNTIKGICRCPYQFSCWNKSDSNYALIQRVTDTDIIFCICKRIAGRAISGVLEDNTAHATHYHTKSTNPSWSRGKIPCAEIGRHLFYNDIET